MGKRIIIATIALIIFAVSFTGCDTSTSSNTFDITVGDYTFEIPDLYNAGLV